MSDKTTFRKRILLYCLIFIFTLNGYSFARERVKLLLDGYYRKFNKYDLSKELNFYIKKVEKQLKTHDQVLDISTRVNLKSRTHNENYYNDKIFKDKDINWSLVVECHKYHYKDRITLRLFNIKDKDIVLYETLKVQEKPDAEVEKVIQNIFYKLLKKSSYFDSYENKKLDNNKFILLPFNIDEDYTNFNSFKNKKLDNNKFIVIPSNSDKEYNVTNIEKRSINIFKTILKNKGLKYIKPEDFKYLLEISPNDISDEKIVKRISDKTGARWIISCYIQPSTGNNPFPNMSLTIYDRTYGGNLFSVDEDISTDIKHRIARSFSTLVNKADIAGKLGVYKNSPFLYINEISAYSLRSHDLYISPSSIAIDMDNNLIVPSPMKITKYNRYGKILSTLKRRGNKRGFYTTATHAVADTDNNMVVYDNNRSKIIIYNKNKKFINEFSVKDEVLSNFAASDKKTIFLVDNIGKKVTIVKYTGKIVNNIKLNSMELALISRIENKVALFIRDRDSDYYRLEYYDGYGKLLQSRKIFINQVNYFINNFHGDRNGNIYAVDSIKGLLLKINKKNQIEWSKTIGGRSSGFIGNICTTPDGEDIFILGSAAKKIYRFSTTGKVVNSSSEKTNYKLALKSRADKKKYLYYLNKSLTLNPDFVPSLMEKASFFKNNGIENLSIDIYSKIKSFNIANKNVSINLDKELKESKFKKYLQSGDIYTKDFNKAVEEIGPETARQFYNHAIKDYEIALKISPGNKLVLGKIVDLKQKYKVANGEVELPPVEIANIKLSPIFASIYKYYNNSPVGVIRIKNTTGKTIKKFNANFLVKDFMDYPTDSRLYRNLKPDDEMEIKLYSVFNNKILNLEEDTPLNARIDINYQVDDKEYTLTKHAKFKLFNRNALTWDDTNKLSAFITPRDNPVKIFSRDVVQKFRNSRVNFINSNLQKAIQIYDALGVFGLTYVSDPKTPYISISKKKSMIDYIQYSRDSLRFKTGDCDDLTVLTSSLLENIGIETALVTVPGHIFMMFNTDVPVEKYSTISNDRSKVIFYEDRVWIPIETTLLGSSFIESWDKGAKQYNRHSKNLNLKIYRIRKAWEKFNPVTLSDSGWEPVVPPLESISKLFSKDLNTLIDREIKSRLNNLNKKLGKNPKDYKTINKIGITYGRYGKYKKAKEYFNRALDVNKNYFSAINNLANVHLLENHKGKALALFQKAAKLKPGNSYVHINIALLYHAMNDTKRVENALRTVKKLNNDLARQYSYLTEENENRSRNIENNKSENLLWISK